MDIIYILPLLSYFSGLVVYCLSRKHFLVMLLSLEFITLSVFFSLFMTINYQTLNLFFLMIFLTMAVCEGVLGLSIMVVTIRSVGNEYVMGMSLLW